MAKTTKPHQWDDEQTDVPEQNALIVKAIKLREKAAKLYQQADAIEESLFDQLPVGKPIVTLPDGRVVTLIDVFADGNTAFRSKSFRRFELQVKKPPKSK